MISLISCSKEIEFNYVSIDKITMVEAEICNNGMFAKITNTVDMNNHVLEKSLQNCQVEIFGEDNQNYKLEYNDSLGYYINNSKVKAEKNYTLNILLENGTKIIGKTYIPKSCQIDSIVFEDINFGNIMEMSTANIYFENGKDDYLQFIEYINQERVKANIISNVEANDFLPTERTLPFFTQPVDTTYDTDDFVRYREGDSVKFELRSHNKDSYEYLLELNIGANQKTNPSITNLECKNEKVIGFFKGYYQSQYTCIPIPKKE